MKLKNEVHVLYEFSSYTYQKSFSPKIIISLCTEKMGI